MRGGFVFLMGCSILVQSGVVVISLFVLVERNEEDKKTYSCFFLGCWMRLLVKWNSIFVLVGLVVICNNFK